MDPVFGTNRSESFLLRLLFFFHLVKILRDGDISLCEVETLPLSLPVSVQPGSPGPSCPGCSSSSSTCWGTERHQLVDQRYCKADDYIKGSLLWTVQSFSCFVMLHALFVCFRFRLQSEWILRPWSGPEATVTAERPARGVSPSAMENVGVISV